jgi:hypothetical protein
MSHKSNWAELDLYFHVKLDLVEKMGLCPKTTEILRRKNRTGLRQHYLINIIDNRVLYKLDGPKTVPFVV